MLLDVLVGRYSCCAFEISAKEALAGEVELFAHGLDIAVVLVEELLEKLKEMSNGPERDELVRQTANQMKRDLMTWGHGSADDEKVADDIARLTDGIIQLDLGQFRFDKVTAITPDEGKRSRRRK